MGMFDTLSVPCPRCGKEIEYQSKAGDCTLADYNLSNVPASIAGDVNGEVEQCECGAEVKLLVQAVVTPLIVSG